MKRGAPTIHSPFTQFHPTELFKMRILWNVLKWLVTIFLFPVTIAFVVEAINTIAAVRFQDIAWTLFGIAVYLILYAILGRSNNWLFIETFEHEVCHMLVSLVAFERIAEFLATPFKGGHVAVDNPHTGIVNALAPYVLPLFTLPFLLMLPFFGPPVRYGIEVAIGFTLAFHISAVIRQFGCRQTDIQRGGYCFSLTIVVIINVTITIGILSFILEDPDVFIAFINAAIETTVDIYLKIWDFIECYVLVL